MQAKGREFVKEIRSAQNRHDYEGALGLLLKFRDDVASTGFDVNAEIMICIEVIVSVRTTKIIMSDQFYEQEFNSAMEWFDNWASWLNQSKRVDVNRLKGRILKRKISFLKNQERFDELLSLLKNYKPILESNNINVGEEVEHILLDKALKIIKNYRSNNNDESGYQNLMRLISENIDILIGHVYDAETLKGMVLISKINYLFRNGQQTEARRLYKENRDLIIRTDEKLKKIKTN